MCPRVQILCKFSDLDAFGSAVAHPCMIFNLLNWCWFAPGDKKQAGQDVDCQSFSYPSAISRLMTFYKILPRGSSLKIINPWQIWSHFSHFMTIWNHCKQTWSPLSLRNHTASHSHSKNVCCQVFCGQVVISDFWKKKKESGAVKENLSTIESRALSLDRDILHIRQSQTGTPVRIWLHNFNVGDFCTATPF